MQDVDLVALLLFALPPRNLAILWLELGVLWTLLIAFLLIVALFIVLLLLEVASAVVSFMILIKSATVQFLEIEQANADDGSNESCSSTSSAWFPSSVATTEIEPTLPVESEPLPRIIDTTSYLSDTFSTIVEHNIRAGLVVHSAILLNTLILSLDETSLDSSLDSDGTPSPAFSDFSDFSYSPESDWESGSNSEPESVASSIGDDYDLPWPSAPIIKLSTTTLDAPPLSPSPLQSSLLQSTLNPSASTFAPSPSPRIALSNLSTAAPSFAPAPTHSIDALLTPPPKVDFFSLPINELNLRAELAAAERTKVEGDRFLREANVKWEQSPEGIARAREWRQELEMQSEWRRWGTMSWESRQRELAACRMERERARQLASWQMDQQRMRTWGC
ncbi:hypothetical protein RQP46_004294 [Phenoliferia psychrophenolica]